MKKGIHTPLMYRALAAILVIALTLMPIFPSLESVARAEEPAIENAGAAAPAADSAPAPVQTDATPVPVQSDASPSAASTGFGLSGTTTTPQSSAVIATTTVNSTANPVATTSDPSATTTMVITGTSTPEVTTATSSLSGSTTGTGSTTASTTAPTITNDSEQNTSTSSPTIQSGRAVAMANILNILNANLVNSDGRIILSNYFDKVEGTLDFRPDPTTAQGCAIFSCDGSQGIDVRLLNEANIENAILLQASSGDNQIEGGADAKIGTGDAFAGLNMINIANTNLIDSKYLLISVNAFQDVNGDIVFPGFSSFMNGSSTAASGTFNNNAAVENGLQTNADSGGNSTDSASSTIITGSTHSASNVFNQINTSLSGGHNVSILLRVHGSWVGQIFGAPADLDRTDMGDSTMLMSNGTSTQDGSANTNATNTASIRNNASISALTGDNRITGASTALISSGNAYAGANLVNIANSNIVGRNWVLAILNIFGDFKGNISFGRPDLWVGEQASVGPAGSNSREIEYKISVINNGDAEATDVALSDAFEADRLEIMDSSEHFSNDGGTLHWDLGTIPPGGAKEITYRARMRQKITGIKMNNSVKLVSRQTDNNTIDNTDTITVEIPAPPMSWGAPLPPPPKIGEEATSTDMKSAPLEVMVLSRDTPGVVLKNKDDKVFQKLVLRNTGGQVVRSVVLKDTLEDPSGNTLKNEEWKIGIVRPHEDIILTYEIGFGEKASPGIYTLSTAVRGVGTSTREFPMNGAIEVEPSAVAAASSKKPLVKLARAQVSSKKTVITKVSITHQDELPLPQFMVPITIAID